MLSSVDLSQSIERDVYKNQLLEEQLRMRKLAHRLYDEKRGLILVFEGWDAAGKGGVIRRFTEKLDPRGYIVHSIASPGGDDAKHHYLWRFWRRLSPVSDKQISIFDRSWYGRVLVERVEGFATEAEWSRAYGEINAFEQQLAEHGIIVMKFWMHVSAEEQLRRFEARRETPHKRWKLTEEDWRNREKWAAYESAVEEMIDKTSVDSAPWNLIAANDKRFARVETLRRIVKRVSEALD